MQTVIVACGLTIGLNIVGHGTIRGTGYNGERNDDGSLKPPPFERVHGVLGAEFAITRNFPKNVWDGWFNAIGRHLDLVQQGYILAHENWGELLTMIHNTRLDVGSMSGAPHYGTPDDVRLRRSPNTRSKTK